jgi:hypothetical protein
MRSITFALLLSAVIVIPGILEAQSQGLPSLPSGLQMRADNRYFDIRPRIVPADRQSTVEIIPKFDHVRFKPDCRYELSYAPVEQIAVKSGWKPKVKEPLVPENGRVRITKIFEAEQEHSLVIEEIKPDKKRAVFCVAHVYSLDPDLFALRPFKGEFHMHSNNSDGVESPAYVAGASRRAGLDFMALTDHRQYRPSVLAAEVFTDTPVDLRIFPGEEVHPPDNPVHIVSFGARSGISELYSDPASEKVYRNEVAKIQASLGNLPAGVDPYLYASCVWASNRIRERGGLSMFAHAYWYTDNKFGAPGPTRDLLLQKRVFDVLELVSGFDAAELNIMDTNGLQVARYYEEAAKGNRLAIAGISDAHGVEKSEAFGRFYTICFAPSCDLADIQASIREFRSVAVEAIQGERPRPFGPFRLVKFTHFLLREVFPQHDELCWEEGHLMIRHAAGDTGAAARLRLLRGQVEQLYRSYWQQ